MNGLILIGGSAQKAEYIEKILRREKIPQYNINSFAENLKIAEARDIIRKISISSSGKRIFIFESEVNLEAQNALLKTLEELPDDVFMVFCDAKNLLPTIFSRCSIISLANPNLESLRGVSEKLYVSISKKSLHGALAALDQVLEEKEVADLIKGLREICLADAARDKNIGFNLKLLKLMNKKYPLITTNNLNAKLAIERCIIEVLG